MKPLINYYGGKQRLANWIIQHFPMDFKERIYCEPCFGSGAVFFAKPPSKLEYIADKDDRLYRFYRFAQKKPTLLYKTLRRKIVFQKDFQRASLIVRGQEQPEDELDYVCCIWMVLTWGFNRTLKSVSLRQRFTLDKFGIPAETQNKLAEYPRILQRIKRATILNTDVFDTIRKIDRKHTFFYIDPPYPGVAQMYKYSWTIEKFNKLIKELTNIKGLFILSFYMQDGMKFPESWEIVKKKTRCTLGNNHGDIDTNRQEFIARNYKTRGQITF